MNASKVARRVHGNNPAGVRVRPMRTKAAALREALAEKLDVPLRTLPRDLVSLLAIADYENAQEEYENADAEVDGDDGPMCHAFELHDRIWAEENGVCPRCSSSHLVRKIDPILETTTVIGCKHCHHNLT